ncbi:MAG TPA: reverse transcriptase domain-containing protein [Candidatus Acidoferrales bacterium]|nr:reverse transcriptase domain-containing protein [Candidatus Acidoferrales bacterium]
MILANARASQSTETRREVEDFALNADAHLDRIQRQLNLTKFKFLPARGVVIPKRDRTSVRPIVVAPIDSRIVQRAVHDVLLSVPAISALSNNPFSFGGVTKHKDTQLGAVPAAIRAVLSAIEGGAKFVVRSDVTSFFARIPKLEILAIVERAVSERAFLRIFEQAITVELANLASLGARASEFPLQNIGVAQGSSLSPLLGNILLFDFDRQMNSGDVRCIRYIDDFVILAKSPESAERAFSYACRLLKQHGLSTSTNKTFKGFIANRFEFLGIEIGNGYITPSRASRKKLLDRIRSGLDTTVEDFRTVATGVNTNSPFSLLQTLVDISGAVKGWGHHYSFCNNRQVFSNLDTEIDQLLREYFAKYSTARKTSDSKASRRLLGIPLLNDLAPSPFQWPKRAKH